MTSQTDNRYGHIDALKGAGILLVVFGHFIEQPSADSALLHTTYIDIYSFHMPLFVFLSGIFARETLVSRDYQKIIWTLFFPLVVFQVVYMTVGYLTDWYTYSPFAPYWILWFVASMIGWRILLPLFASPVGLLVALFGALLAGYDDSVGYALSASRTIYFLPYFVLGHLYGMHLVAIAKRHRTLFACVFVMTMAAITFWWLHGLDASALTGSHDYDSAPPDATFPGLGRLLVMLLSMVAVLGFCAVVPDRWGPLERLGERSLSIYLLHGLVVMVFMSSALPDLVPLAWALPVYLALAVLVATVTAQFDGAIRHVFHPPPGTGEEAGDPFAGWLRRLH